MHYQYEYNGERYQVDLKRLPDGKLQATIADREYIFHASAVRDGTWLLQLQDERRLVHTAHDSEAVYVQIAGVQYTLNRVDGRYQQQGSQSASGNLTSEMPGQVIEVRVAEGDAVAEGDVLVVLEAMKMEIRVSAPRAGQVAAVHVKMGDIVERGASLVELDSDDV